MKIGLLVHPYEPERPGGLGRANFAYVEALLKSDRANSYTIYLKGAPHKTSFSTYQNATVVWMGNGPLWLTGFRALDPSLDLYVFFNPIIPLFFYPKKSIVIAYDFAFLKMGSSSLKDYIQTWFTYMLQYRSLHKATRVVTISDATKEDIVQYFKIARDKINMIHVGYMALTQPARPMSLPEPFFLFAGVLKERKNVAGIIRAFAVLHASHPGITLVIAGKKEGAYYQSLLRLITELQIASHIHFLGYVSNEELAYLFSKAVALVFPSFVEGFGMPVLEAMHAGTPVITSREGALAEVAGTAALLVDPHDPADIANAMRHIAEDAGLREELVKKGYARAAEFSWEKTGQKLVEVINSLA